MKSVRLVLSLLVVWALSTSSVQPSLAADEGEKAFDESCVTCHTPEVMKEKLKGKVPTREEWNDILKKMVGLGAEVPRKKQPALVDYLLRAFTPAAGTNAATPEGRGSGNQGAPASSK